VWVQLEGRGKLTGARDDYFAFVVGKTAALFRWALAAGAGAAGLPPAAEGALARYGLHLGVAFQAVDDELDYGGAADAIGKDPLADLREGKVTFPLVVALEGEPALSGVLEGLLAEAHPAGAQLAAVAARIRDTGALAATRALAEDHVRRALGVLDELPAGPARDALATVALASLERTS
jgi:octaprenyl-diphosphate synthase